MSKKERENTSIMIRECVQQLNQDGDLLMFVRKTDYRNDGYVQRQIWPYPNI
jgi:hypothetical protein